jgi:hypothetical protein
MKIQHVPVEFIHQTWSQVNGFIQSAIDQQDGDKDYLIEHVKTFLVTGQWLLLVASNEEKEIKGAAVVSFSNRPSHRVAFINYIGGRLITNPSTFTQMCEVLKHYGATSIEGAVNDAVASLWQRYGFTEKYSIVGVKI